VQREMARRQKKADEARTTRSDDVWAWVNARDELIRILQDVTKVLIELDKHDQALVLYRKATELLSIGKPSPSLHCDILLSEAEVYDALGRKKEADAALDGVVAIYERDAVAVEHDMFLSTSCIADDPVKALAEHGRFKEAVKILKLVLRKINPLKRDEQSTVFEKLAEIYDRLGQYSEAEAAYKQALPSGELKAAEVGAWHASVLLRLMLFYHAHGRRDEAVKILRVLEEIDQELLKKQSSDAQYLAFRGMVYQQLGKLDEAQESFSQAIPLLQREEPTPKLAALFDQIAFGYQRLGATDLALDFSRLATATISRDHAPAGARRNLTVLGVASMSADRNREMERFSFFGVLPQDEEYHVDYFGHHLASLADVDRKQPASHQQLGREAMEVSQRAYSSLTAAALQQMVVRFANGGGALADLVRESQDLAAFERDEDRRLADELSKPLSAQDANLIDSLRKTVVAIESKLSANTARIEREFPDYATFASPKPLKMEDVQPLLGPDEAMLFYLVGEKETYAFTVTREKFDWKAIPIGGAAMTEKVVSFRRGLDLDRLGAAVAKSERVRLFDLNLANELYTILIGPFEEVVKDKKKLLIVPSGALTALPFHIMVTKKPAAGIPERLEGYREAAWLIKRQAVTVLPSVASLQALRIFASGTRAAKPMIGFGDPVFNPDAKPSSRARLAANSSARNLAKQPYGDFWQGPQVDRTKLAQGLPRLPDTADELRAVGKDVGASMSDIHLGKDASEATVKRLPLADYRIVYFATHGLVAGTVKGLGEPSLALSIPAQPSELDDGLLTASEVAQLKLNADWVVLSACNTAAGDSPDAEALSGLARAFFYAGARALLVSHWAMSSDAATRLTTSTFDILKVDPTIDRAEALRRAELTYLNDTSDRQNAYPAFWGPFEIVGEGTSRPVVRK
jgi:CHAT domain-containing protein/tetratricopeptide (TPR) repeat protein